MSSESLIMSTPIGKRKFTYLRVVEENVVYYKVTFDDERREEISIKFAYDEVEEEWERIEGYLPDCFIAIEYEILENVTALEENR